MSGRPVVTIVDDDEAVRLGVDNLLRSLGYRTSVFDSAEAFLQGHAAGDTACVVSDVQMAGMSGIELQGLLRRREPGVPVILMSGYTDRSAELKALADGARFFLHKPFDADALIDCLQQVLPLRH